jgi:hypothetical protein
MGKVRLQKKIFVVVFFIIFFNQVTEDKKYLDMHTNISKAISEQLQSRGFVHLWKAECELLRGSNPDLTPLLSSGSSADHLRLLVLAAASGARPTVPPQLAGNECVFDIQKENHGFV